MLLRRVSASLTPPIRASFLDASDRQVNTEFKTSPLGARSLAGRAPNAKEKPLVAAGLSSVLTAEMYLSTTRFCNLADGPFELTGKLCVRSAFKAVAALF